MQTVTGSFERPHLSGGYHSSLNPQVEVQISEVSEVEFIFATSLGSNSCALCLFLTKPKRNDGRSTLPKEEIIEKSQYLRSNKVTLSCTLLPGRYIAVLCLEKVGLKGSFKLSAKGNVSKLRVLPDYSRVSVTSSWDKLNGGYKSPKNPQFCLTLKKKSHVVIRLSDKNKSNPLYVYVTKTARRKNTRRKVVKDSEIVAQSRYLISTEVKIEIDLDPEPDRPFLLIPCSGKLPIDFTLVVESDTEKSIVSLKEVVEKENKVIECSCKEIIDQHRDLENPPYLKTNPIFDITSHCRAHGCMFKDSDFPASETSLNKNDGRNVERVRGVGSWKRPSQFLENPDLYCDGIEIQDMRQGSLPDCWLCQGLATSATTEERISSLISPSKYSNYGVYVFKVYHEDEWKFIVVDDYIPLNENDNFLFARSQDPNELWVPLFEKAFAKAFGSYRALTRRSIGVALLKLTGGETSIQFHDKITPQKLWDQMVEYDSQKWLMGASSKDQDQMGIKSQHAYSIMSVHDVSVAKLVKIRNTWGNFEWVGAWSDNDEKNWTGQIKRKLKFENKDDGIFYMAIEDYHKHYSSTTFCKIVNDLYPYTYKYRSDWSKDYSAPHPLRSTGLKIPLRTTYPDTTLHCSLVRTSNDIKDGENAILLYMVSGHIKTKLVPQEQVFAQSRYMYATKVKLEKTVKQPSLFHLIPTATNQKEEYTVIVHSNKEIEFGGKYKEPYPHKFVVTGDWSPCGGYLMTKNPKFNIQVCEKGDTEVILDLERTDKKRMLGILMVIVKSGTKFTGNRHPQVQKNEMVAESRYLMSNEISLTTKLKWSKNPYVLVICAQSKFAGLKYRITCKSDKKINFGKV